MELKFALHCLDSSHVRPQALFSGHFYQLKNSSKFASSVSLRTAVKKFPDDECLYNSLFSSTDFFALVLKHSCLILRLRNKQFDVPRYPSI